MVTCTACALRIQELEDELMAWRSSGQASLREGARLDRLALYKRRFGLTPGNAAVLLAFVDGPDKVMTRDGILTLTQPFAQDGERNDRAADTRIKHVRRALANAKVGGDAAIETLYGVGYLMTAAVAQAVREAAGA